MSIEAVWAQSAVRVALRPTVSRGDASHILRRAARLHPQAIADKIASLRDQIRLLEAHLPKVQP